MKLFKTKQKASYRIMQVIVLTIFIVYAASLVYSIFWAFLTSLKTHTEFKSNSNGFPKEWLFSNYVEAFKMLSVDGHGIIQMFFNSLWYAGGGAILSVFVSSMVAYVVAKYKFPGRKLLHTVALLTMMLPIVGAMPSQFKVFDTLKILNTPWMLLASAGGFGFNFIILYSYFKSLPWTYAEAGFIDGAKDLRVFLQIMLPQALSVMGSLLIVAGIGMWNDYMSPLLFLRDYPTLSAGLYAYQIKNSKFDVPLLFAGLLMSTVPVVILFVCFQNTMMDMTMAGGIKG